MKTQNARIIDRMLANPMHGITSLEAAMMQPAIMRLSERIREIEADGAYIYRADERTIGQRGKYTRYYLKSLKNYRPKESVDHPMADAIHDAELARL